MEKKETQRGSPGILPKSPLLYEKYKAGCGWRLINFFGFRQDRSGKKLISAKSHRFRDSSGNVYTKSQLDLLQRLHEKCQCNNNVNAQPVVEEEISCRPKTRRRSSVSGTEHEKYYPKSVREIPSEARRTKNLKVETFDNSVQGEGKVCFSEQNQSSLTETERSEKKTSDKQLSMKKGWDQICKNLDPDLEKCPEINLHVCVNEATEALICQKAKKGSDQSKQFLEALDVLSSNKELFVTLLQDPNSFSAKRGQDFPGSRPKDREAKCSSNTATFETRVKDVGEPDELDRIVVLKPRLTSSGEDASAYLRFKHMAKKLKLVIGSNKNDRCENKLLGAICSPEDSCEANEAKTAPRKSDAIKRMEKTSEERDYSQRRSDASMEIFKCKKRVGSYVFKSTPENDLSPRRLMVERQHERTSSSPVYEVPHALSSFWKEHDTDVSPETRLKDRNQKQHYRLQSSGKNVEVFNSKHGFQHRSSDECFSERLDEDGCGGSAAYSNLRPGMEDECLEQRSSESSCMESCKDNHSTILEMKTLISEFSSPERSNSNVNDHKQEQEHPSPVSVLTRFHIEEDSASPGIANPLIEEHIGLSSEPRIDLTSVLERGSVQEFVKIVLKISGLNWTELITKCTVSSLESSLLDQFSHNDQHQHLVLDYTSEVLNELYRDIKSWPFIRLKNPRLALFALRNDLVHQAMKLFDWNLLCHSGPRRTLDQLMEKDLTKPCLWMDFGGETEGVVSDVVEQVLEQLEMEVATELGTMATRIF
ncbi:PREDICTED: uncharacterized protein LOC104817974 [Tarenaya hassleriana]|uniref:uncharacterized protein LOC104817974 n=1 Tax=Tarenaya hassleriana TaxID=28532 RepID=UPI00053C7B6E|nr:PREDICTED: uncharacterized protein LOC104817974 [Tarenaya hassleriana]XP_010545697.1 PREDICTED: uncharacterized protein LOC104817974 [Tarenaya hassleriana]XP_010545705.1 PREDICTED: uncharacterized protein LOC104817974 [Tarenaya hassleriana]